MIKQLVVDSQELYFGQFDHPYVRLHTQFGALECMIDTGFSLGLVLPQKYNAILKDATALPADLVLGDGGVISAQSYLFALKKVKESLGMISVISFNQKEGLVGVEFLRLWGETLSLDWQGQRVEFLP